MRNTLKRYYYVLSKFPLTRNLASILAPLLKKIAERWSRQALSRAELSQLLEEQGKTLLALKEEVEILLRERAISAHAKRNSLKFSVIVSTCDRKDFLKNALESLAQQNYAAFEVICVDGGSDSGTKDLLKQWEDKIKICHCPERNLSLSRNIGIAAAAGDLVAFMDDDAVAPSNWLQELEKGYLDAEIAAVGGFIRDHTGVDWQARVLISDRFGDTSHFNSVAEAFLNLGGPEQWNREYFMALTGTNLSFRRDVLPKVGGFDENYAYHLEETDILLRLADAGHRIVCREQAEIIHKYAPSHMRAPDRTPTSLYHNARSKTYFILRHARPLYGEEMAQKRISGYLAFQEASVRAAYKQGRLSGSAFERLCEELRAGFKDGRDLAERPSANKTKFDQAPPPFKRFPKYSDFRRCESIFCSDYNPGETQGQKSVHERIKALRAKGHEVHVYRLAKARATLDFINGIWVHSAPTSYFYNDFAKYSYNCRYF